jgi:hypothetical protein
VSNRVQTRKQSSRYTSSAQLFCPSAVMPVPADPSALTLALVLRTRAPNLSGALLRQLVGYTQFRIHFIF